MINLNIHNCHNTSANSLLSLTVTMQPPAESGKSSNELAASIAGGVTGGLLAISLLLIVIFIILLRFWRKRTSKLTRRYICIDVYRQDLFNIPGGSLCDYLMNCDMLHHWFHNTIVKQ